MTQASVLCSTSNTLGLTAQSGMHKCLLLQFTGQHKVRVQLLMSRTSMAASVRFCCRESPSSGIRLGGPPMMNRREDEPSLMMSPTLHCQQAASQLQARSWSQVPGGPFAASHQAVKENLLHELAGYASCSGAATARERWVVVSRNLTGSSKEKPHLMGTNCCAGMRFLFTQVPCALPGSYRKAAPSEPLNCSTACRRLTLGCSIGICSTVRASAFPGCASSKSSSC